MLEEGKNSVEVRCELNTDAPAMASMSMLKIGRTYQKEVRRVLQGSAEKRA